MRAKVPLIGIGCTLVAASWLARLTLSRAAAPGRLVAETTFQEWVSPPYSDARSFPQAAAEFGVVNKGGRAVRVTSVESGCGCATPKVEPEVIDPGGRGAVTIQALPLPVGERTVTFAIQTDSPATPRLTFQLRMIGGREPPFIFKAGGDLSWMQGASPDQAREVTVRTVERLEKLGRPALSSDLPFLRFEPVSERDGTSTEPGTVPRTYVYEVRPSPEVPEGTFTGEVRVTPAWGGPPETIPVSGRSSRPLRALPSSVRLRLKDRSDVGAEASLHVILADPDPGVRAEPERADGPLAVERREVVGPGRFVTFAVRLRAGSAPVAGSYGVVVRPSAGAGGPLTVPVVLTIGGEG